MATPMHARVLVEINQYLVHVGREQQGRLQRRGQCGQVRVRTKAACADKETRARMGSDRECRL
jgi:hypothetical protein